MESRAGVHVQSGLLGRLKGALWAVGTVCSGVSRTTLASGKVVGSVGPSLEPEGGVDRIFQSNKVICIKKGHRKSKLCVFFPRRMSCYLTILIDII